MARKRLIKGVNASRVEERIARVPADVQGPEAGPSIFGALRALEESEAGSHPPEPEKAEPKARTTPRRKSAPRKPALITPEPKVEPEPPKAADPPARQARLGPSDFNAAEREAIVRCCSDYRNRLPIYLLDVQQEVQVIDSVIEKCRSSKGPRKKA